MEPSECSNGPSSMKLQSSHLWKALLVEVACHVGDYNDAQADRQQTVASHVRDQVDVYSLQLLEDDVQTPIGELLLDLEQIDSSSSYSRQMCERFCDLCSGGGGIHALHTLIGDLGALLASKGSNRPPLLHPFSLAGIYIREVLAAFRSLSFERACQLYLQWQDSASNCSHPLLASCLKINSSYGSRNMLGLAAIPSVMQGLQHTASPIMVHSEEAAATATTTTTVPHHHSVMSSSGIDTLDELTSSTPLRQAQPRHFPASAPMSAVCDAPLPCDTPSDTSHATPGMSHVTRGIASNLMTSSSSSSLVASAGESRSVLLSENRLQRESRMSLAETSHTTHEESTAAVKKEVSFFLPPLDTAQLFEDEAVDNHSDKDTLQEIADDLFLAQQRQDWSLAVNLHHKFFDMKVPHANTVNGGLQETSEAELRRASARTAIRHCGHAVRDLSSTAAAIGYRHEAAMLRNRSIEVALMTDDRESQLWALSDVLTWVQPVSREASVFSQQLLARCDDGSAIVKSDDTNTGTSVRHLAHMWRSWCALFKSNEPMHVVLDELTQGWGALLDDSQYDVLPHFLSFMASVYHTFSYSCCVQLLSQMLMSTTCHHQLPGTEGGKPKAKPAVDRLCHIRLVISHLISCSLAKSDMEASLKLLQYDERCQSGSEWPVLMKEPISVLRCEVHAEACLAHCQWKVARLWIDEMRAHDQTLAQYYDVRLLFDQTEFCQARALINNLIADQEKAFARVERLDVNFTPMLLARSLLLKAQILGESLVDLSQALHTLSACLSLCKSFNLTSVFQSAVVTKVDLQITNATTAIACNTLLPWLPQILANGSVRDQCKALLLYARILLDDSPERARRQDLSTACEVLKDCAVLLERCDVVNLLLLYNHWMCRVYRALGDQATCRQVAGAVAKYLEVAELDALIIRAH